jgi:hypothetical protein
MVLVSLLTPGSTPAGVRRVMVRLHAPEGLDLNRDITRDPSRDLNRGVNPGTGPDLNREPGHPAPDPTPRSLGDRRARPLAGRRGTVSGPDPGPGTGRGH